MNDKKTLHTFQKDAVDFIVRKEGKALIAYDMGLGKTAIACSWVKLVKASPILIVCPSFLKINWRREIRMWIGNEPLIYEIEGEIPTKEKVFKLRQADIIICSYAVLYQWRKEIGDVKLQAMILDEAHYISNWHTQRAVACNSIVSRSGVQNRIALTGTPINSKVRDLFHIIKWIDPTIFPSEVKFMLKYCGLTKTDRGMNDGGAYNLNDLHTILTNTIMIRKKKSEVLTELPDKQRYIIPLELSSWLKYNKAEQGFKDWVNGHSAREQTTGLAKIEYMKQAIWEGKKKEVINWIKNFIEATDEKLIVFGIHKKVIADLKQAMPHGSVVITGDVSNEDKQRAVDAFQNDPKVRLLFGNIDAAGVGLTLTAASTVAIVELPWTPTKVEQAIDRAHRIGQKNSVIVYFLLADKTLDRTIYTDVLGVKARAIEAAIDGKEYKQEESYLKILMDKYKGGVK